MSVAKIIARRRSCRAYTSAPVPRGHIEQVLDAARLAPSACNQQPWRFAVVTDVERKRTIIEQGFRPGLSMPWANHAPVLIVLGMKKSLLVHRAAVAISKVDYPWIDIGIAGEHLVLQAEELGLGTCWIGWVKPARIRRLVGWPSDVHPAAVITLGWPENPDAPPPQRPRKDLSTLVTWLAES
ncbi:MAG: NAD(P)H nitroreductase [Verrucomicrobia bacterium]|nr:NAD(P)H nitroreductase [Verrucomicrobiota bacterium]MBT7067985.1 NAD(P)H nitroreductase [Verrucomicrobiota bacterium]MBT7699265.1 NAD(P)H nitroreductase [Verrucomicrobiota bacterium]